MYALPGKDITQVFNRQPRLFVLLSLTISVEQLGKPALALSSAFLNLNLRDHTLFTHPPSPAVGKVARQT